MSVQIVWFRRDLRVDDHLPLQQAAARGPLLPLYIVEPALLQAADFDSADWRFIEGCLAALRTALAALGQPLIVRVGAAATVLQSLCRQLPVVAIWTHEETANWLAYQRNLQVAEWAGRSGIALHLLAQDGVSRGLHNRNDWHAEHKRRLRAKVAAAPESIEPVKIQPGRIPTAQQLRLPRDRRKTQAGGSAQAQALLDSFLTVRAAHYQDGLALAARAAHACSRLGPHLAYGTISERQVVQQLRTALRGAVRGADPPLRHNLQLFESRLQQRGRAMQQLANEPEIEFQTLIAAVDGLRGDNSERFERWQQGLTGYPLVDAAMRALTQTGYINFNLRRLLVSFACFDLWLDWRKPAQYLARLFLDYEPGIHYTQMQMQAGVDGGGVMAIADPTAMALAGDPQAIFIRQWLPQLADVPDQFVHAPWRMSGRQLDYPAPIVDHQRAATQAAQRLRRALAGDVAVTQAKHVLERHGYLRTAAKAPSHQLKINFGDLF